MEKELITYIDARGEYITLYNVKIRIEGTRKVYNGILPHNHRWDDNDKDYLSAGIAGLDYPTTADDAEILTEFAAWTQDYRIDGNGYYILEN